MKNTKRLLATATTFAMALGAIGLSGFAAGWKASAEAEYTPLPTTASTYEVEREYHYTYETDANGFYSINLKSITAEVSEFDYFYSILVRTDPDSYDEVVFVSENNYPVYMAAGTTYYLDISIPSAGYGYENENGEYEYTSLTQVTAEFAVEDYVFGDVTLAPYDLVYLPVTSGSMAHYVAHVTDFEDGVAYSLMAIEVPEDASLNVYTNKGLLATLSAANEFSATVYMDGVTEIYLTSTKSFVAGVFFMDNTDVGSMKLGEAEEITLEPYESKAYALTGLSAGVYSVELAGEKMSVEVLYTYGRAVAAWENYGYFTVTEDNATVVLLFENRVADEGEDGEMSEPVTVTFKATVNKAEELMLGEDVDITLSANESKVVYLKLPAGKYEVETDGGVQIVLGGEVIVAADADFGEFLVNGPEEEGGQSFYYVALMLTNTGSQTLYSNIAVYVAK